MVEFEKSWGLGKEHLLDPKKANQLSSFSQSIESASEKHRDFKEQVEYWEADIFISIPCLLVLKSLDEDGVGKQILKRFYPPMF